MRGLTLGTALSILLWTAIIWCVLALRVASGHNHYDLSAHSFGESLLVIDLALLIVAIWIDQELREKLVVPVRTSGPA